MYFSVSLVHHYTHALHCYTDNHLEIAMTILVLITVLALASLSHESPLLNPNSIHVGKVFYLPNHNVLNTITGGEDIFNRTLIQSCLSQTDIYDDRKDLNWYKSKDILYKAVSFEAGLSGSYTGLFTLSTSLQSVDSTVNWHSSDVKSSSLDYGSYKHVLELSKLCAFDRSNLMKNFIDDIESLSTTIKDASDGKEWALYDYVLKKYGSHVLTKLKLGARIQQFATTSNTSSFDESDFEARLCLDFEGNFFGNINISGCSGFSKEQLEASEKFNMNIATFVRGGDENLRAKLQVSLDPTTIEKFVASAQSAANPIQYRFTPVWELIASLDRPFSDMYYRALNMKAFYSGYLEFSCPKRVTTGGFILQQLVEVPEDRGHFQCQFAKEGCRTNDDCHIYLGSKCYCYGDTCIKNDQFGRPQSQTTKTGKNTEWVNSSCRYRVGVYCGCNEPSYGNTLVSWDSQNADSDSHSISDDIL